MGRVGSRAAVVAWGLFCACSWTWCIGMFLPVLMIDRYGLPGLLVFAVPNVLGCAAFGYVLRDAARSRRLAERHGAAMIAFSLVAVGFNLFFVTLLFAEIVPEPGGAAWMPYAIAAAVFVVGALIGLAGDRTWLALAAVTWLFSVGVFASLGLGAAPRLIEPGRLPLGGLAWLAPIFVGGFLLCPYLDLTFHRALQRSPSRHAFGVFGAAFAVMLALTCFLWFAPVPALRWAGLGHILAQTVFTIGAHLREVRMSPALPGPRAKTIAAALPLAALVLLPAVRLMTPAGIGGEVVDGVGWSAGGVGTDTYVRFFVLYGLVFPAYVLRLMVRARSRPIPRGVLIRFGVLLALLAPLYEAGFLHGRPWLFAIPSALALAWLLRPERAAR